MRQAGIDSYHPRTATTDPETAGSIVWSDRRQLRLARAFLIAGTTAICLLQVLAMPVRNPFTRTMSSYEYTWAGWLFPVGLAAFGIGLSLLCRQVPRAHPVARIALLGASIGAAATAVFPSGSGRHGEPTWPGEVHRWGSIALVVGALSGVVLLARAALTGRSRRTIGLLVLCGAVAGALFLVGQLAPSPEGVLGYAPLAGGLYQRILVGIIAVAMVYLVGVLSRQPHGWSRDSPRTGSMWYQTGHGRGRAAHDSPVDPSPVQA